MHCPSEKQVSLLGALKRFRDDDDVIDWQSFKMAVARLARNGLKGGRVRVLGRVEAAPG